MTSEFTAEVETLLHLVARARAIADAERPIRAKVTAGLLERLAEDGQDRARRPDGDVSLVRPQPRTVVDDAPALCDWLEEHGMASLVVERAEVVDHAVLLEAHCSAVTAHALSALVDSHGSDPELVPSVAEPTAAALEALRTAVRVIRQPVADVVDHLTVQTVNGQLVTPDGEVVPGIRMVTDPVTAVRVVPSGGLRGAAATLLAAELGPYTPRGA